MQDTHNLRAAASLVSHSARALQSAITCLWKSSFSTFVIAPGASSFRWNMCRPIVFFIFAYHSASSDLSPVRHVRKSYKHGSEHQHMSFMTSMVQLVSVRAAGECACRTCAECAQGTLVSRRSDFANRFLMLWSKPLHTPSAVFWSRCWPAFLEPAGIK